jgi:small redox-active disulfide protein 2
MKCQKLAKNAQEAIDASGVEDAQLVKVEELQEIMEFGVMSTPALAIDGDVKAAGKVLSVQEIQTMLEGE